MPAIMARLRAALSQQEAGGSGSGIEGRKPLPALPSSAVRPSLEAAAAAGVDRGVELQLCTVLGARDIQQVCVWEGGSKYRTSTAFGAWDRQSR